MAGNTFDDVTCRAKLKFQPVVRSQLQVGMKKSMVAYFMPFAVNPLHQRQVLFGIYPGYKKSSRYLVMIQDIKYPWGVPIIRAIVEGHYNFFGRFAGFVNHITGRQAQVLFFRNQFFFIVDLYVYLPRIGFGNDV